MKRKKEENIRWESGGTGKTGRAGLGSGKHKEKKMEENKMR